jgi:EAL domain-containing protein (putative c-di-GMP-specific phosphodiesterase class I)/CheY-like chemotaxis protein
LANPITVLVADDEIEVRRALADVIEEDPTMVLVGAARDAEEAIELAGTYQPDVALLDVIMPGGGGARAAHEIRACSPETKMLAFSAHQDGTSVREMLEQGVTGYLVKGSSIEEILRAIRRGAAGEASLSREVQSYVVQEFGRQAERQRAETSRRRLHRDRIQRVIRGEGLSVVFQPIRNLRTGIAVGFEALARFGIEPERSPMAWFREAEEVGLGRELELAAAQKVLDAIDRVPRQAYLSVNVSPQTASSPEFLAMVRAAQGARVVVEMTEHAPVLDYVVLMEALAELRSLRVRVAIDDAGSGYATFRHILEIVPDIIKLDIALTRDIDTDVRKRALASALAAFVEEIDATITAEGIETRAELDALLEIGVEHGQGLFLGNPGPLP